MSATAVSDWPTPTVSTSTTSYPAASTTTMASRVALATPPSVPAAGDGRMNAPGSVARRSIRVLSPRMEPPERFDDGSTARTATLCPAAVRRVPSASMNVDLPTPGTPVIPTRRAAPECGVSSTSSRCAKSRWSARLDSTSVMARATCRRSPESTPFTYDSSTPVEAPGQVAEEAERGVGDDRARPEDGRGPGRVERVHVAGRDDAADDDHDVVGAQ